MLSDSFLEREGGLVPAPIICSALGRICIPLSGRRIADLHALEISIDNRDEVMVELELCVSLLFKPVRHHIQNILKEGAATLMSLWVPIMEVVKSILDEGSAEENEIVKSSNELVLEHVRNVVIVLINLDFLGAESSQNDITSTMWTTISEIEGCKQFVEEWKQAAINRQES
jgi:hypothetical protein